MCCVKRGYSIVDTWLSAKLIDHLNYFQTRRNILSHSRHVWGQFRKKNNIEILVASAALQCTSAESAQQIQSLQSHGKLSKLSSIKLCQHFHNALFLFCSQVWENFSCWHKIDKFPQLKTFDDIAFSKRNIRCLMCFPLYPPRTSIEFKVLQFSQFCIMPLPCVYALLCHPILLTIDAPTW